MTPLSLTKLATCDKRIQQIIIEANKIMPLQVLCGHRTLAEQTVAYQTGHSKTMHSKHLAEPSLAVDVAPLDKNNQINWKDLRPFLKLKDVIFAVALRLGYLDLIRWGGDWDRDGITERGEDDYGHYELVLP